MPKIVVLNTDVRGSGINSLAPKTRIQDVFGYPPITAKTWPSIQKIFEVVGDVRATVTQQDIAGTVVQIPEERFVFNPPYDTADGLILDTVDGVYWGLKQHLLGDSIAANQALWDKLTNGAIKFFDKVGAMEIPVIATCHDRGEEKGEAKVISPFMQGAFKDQLGNYFDIIMYTKVYRSASGQVDFKWQVVPDALRPARANEKLFAYAQKTGGEIEQDFVKVFANVEIHNPKILIIGSYGTGKTHSLRTLKNVDFDKIKALNPETQAIKAAA